jgi:hypothetical protein
MGAFLKRNDIYVSSLLELLNLRFGRTGSLGVCDGIDEMKLLQREFGVFKRGRSLAQSLRVLNVGGSWNPTVKQGWFDYLESLDAVTSERAELKGGPAIVARLIENLAANKPLPVFFEPHDLRESGNRVLISVGRPLFYMVEEYIVVGLPMANRKGAKASKSSKGGKKAKRR